MLALSAVDDGCSPALLAESPMPQSPQNLDDGGFSAPHPGHTMASALPHCVQNFFPAGFSTLQFEQRMSGAPSQNVNNIARKRSIAQARSQFLHVSPSDWLAGRSRGRNGRSER
jgi:hypothetical protein